MTPETFLEEFSTVANAPGGVQRLREMILQLAVQGKLVPQNPDDEPAGELLKKIAEKKDELFKTGEIKREKPLPEIRNDEIPFKIPTGWIWSRLGELTDIIRGITFPSSVKNRQPGDGKIACLRTSNIQNTIEWDDLLYISRAFMKKESQLLALNDIVISMANSRELVGKVAIVNSIPHKEATFGGFLGVIRPYLVVPIFIMEVLRTTYARNSLIDSASQTTNIANISLAKLKPFLIPLPPLEEQLRIVAKVDQLMALCDRLEAQQRKRTKLVGHTRKTVLEALADAQGREELCAAWQRVEENLGMLFETPEDVEDLKKSILQNAVMGKLVEQNPEDEPASVLLKKIAAEKAEMIKKGEIKKAKPLPKIRDDEKPFEVPKGWEFSFLQNVCKLITDGTHQTPTYALTGRPFISAQCVKPFRFIPINCRYVSEEHYQNYIKNRKPELNDILLSRVGAGIGEAALIDIDLEFAIYVSTGLLKPFKQYIYPDYIVLWLNSPIGRHFSKKNTLGAGASQGNLNLSLIRQFVVSIPPLAEQHRIVAKVQSLLALCDGLQSRIAESRTIAGQLAQSIIESITGITTEKQEKMKIPKTELVSRLVLAKKPGAREHAPLSELMARHNNELSAKALWNHSGLPIGEFYRQLKIEMINGWIKEPVKAQVRVVKD